MSISPKEVAVVTGGSRGIGAAICEKFAANGTSVVLNYSSARGDAEAVVEKITRAGGSADLYCADVSDDKQARKLVDFALERFGDLSMLVNNAGVSSDGLLYDLKIDAWRRVMEVNFGGTFHMTHAFLPHLMSRGMGSIVNVSSAMGERGWIGESNYAASKGAVNAFTRSVAMESARFGIKVNAVLPGFIDTALVEELSSGPKGASIRKQIPMRQFGKPEDVAEMVWFLSSPASAYVTGSMFTVDGGAQTALGLGRP